MPPEFFADREITQIKKSSIVKLLLSNFCDSADCLPNFFGYSRPIPPGFTFGNLGNLGGLGNLGSLGKIGSLGKMGALGNLGGLGVLGSLGNLGRIGDPRPPGKPDGHGKAGGIGKTSGPGKAGAVGSLMRIGKPKGLTPGKPDGRLSMCALRKAEAV